MRIFSCIILWPIFTVSLPVSEQTAQWRRLLPIIAKANNVQPELLRAIVWHESRYNTRAQSHTADYGLAQLNRRTIASYGLRPVDAMEPVTALVIAAAELRRYQYLYSKAETHWWCRYNVGTGAYELIVDKCRRYVLRVYTDAQSMY